MVELASMASNSATLLPMIWAGILGLAVAIYIALDGFDLGIGMLFAATRDETQRDLLMDSVAPYWDGNETWLVLGGGGLFVAFPLAYSILMPALYLPIILMLLALIFRGVAFEFRGVSKPHHHWWDKAFIGGSVTAAFSQGLILGGLIQGVSVVDGRFAGGTLDWLTPFAVVCGLGTVVGYALLGAGWAIIKIDHAGLITRVRQLGRRLLLGTLSFIAIVSIWTPLAYPRIAETWFSLPNFYFLWPVPTITAALAWLAWRGMGDAHPDRGRHTAYLASLGLFMVCFAGLAISTLPYVVPPTVTIFEAAAAPSSLKFALVGTAVLLPIIMVYTAAVYWVFRGKVSEGQGYH